MKPPQELLKERKERIRKAAALEKTDRTPVVTLADGFCATHMGVKLSEFCSKNIIRSGLDDSKRRSNDSRGETGSYY
ncbi:hypothetical protein [Sporomusa sp. KB1]|jgi:hypothetical protein|uniref:hypothetical protein n=1 Tax=Sporomusa sp. KB1 TaxID=943346 RepID=UPI00164559DF|nr:hypothetical protein [Sporomusa sp. KB1]